MANEVRANLNFIARKNGMSISANPSFKLDMIGNEMESVSQVIGTSSELVAFGEISGAPSAVLIVNLDSANFVEIGGDSGLTVFKIKILPGQFAIFQPTSGNLYAQADTAAVRIQVVATEA